MSKCMFVNFNEAIYFSKPSDSKRYRGFKIFSDGSEVDFGLEEEPAKVQYEDPKKYYPKK